MSPPRLAVIALLSLLVTAGIAIPAQVGDPDQTIPAHSIAALGLEEDERSGFAVQSIDASIALAMDRDRASVRLERHALAAAFEAAEDEQARREILFEAATDVEIAISSLRADQRDVRQAYVAGAIDESTLLRRQAVFAARANALHSNLDQIAEYADRIPGFSMESRIDSLRASLTGFDGPVSDRIRRATTGEHNATRLYVATSRNGTVFATIDDGVYLREAYRSDNWVPDSISDINLDRVEGLTYDRYPTAANSSQVVGRSFRNVNADIDRIEITYEQGAIFAYMDGDTEKVFYEIHRQPLDQIIPGSAVSTVDNGVRLMVNRTRAGSPLRVAVVDNSTNTPLQTTVVVDGHEVQTGLEGVAWTLMPAEQAEVTAVTARGNVSLSVRPE